MKWLMGSLVLVLFSCLPARAQTPAFEVGGGYAFRSFDTPGGSRLQMHGWNANADFNLNQWLGVAGEVVGTYDDQGANGNNHIYSFLAGPRVYPTGHHKITPFGQVLFGYGRWHIDVPAAVIDGTPEPAFTVDTDSFAFAFGAGADFSVTRRVAIRLGPVQYEQTRFFQGPNMIPPASNQNNVTAQASIIFRFGRR
jgi:opacity protein-like surface antigen